MTVHELSRADARRLAVRAQLLDRQRPTDLMDVVRHLTLLQVDAVKAVAPSADLVAWSRLGPAYDPEQLARAVRDQTLVEFRTMLRPREDLALYRADMAQWPGVHDLQPWEAYAGEWVRTNEACRREILVRLETDGPLTSRELPDICEVPWQSTGWNNNRNVGRMLDCLMQRGDVAVVGRRGRDRLWDLASRVYADDPVVPADEALRVRNERRLRSLGIARATGPDCPEEPLDVGDVGEQAVVEDVRGTWRVDPTLLGQPFAGRTALLSPLDRLIYDRKRMVDLFEFDYQLEMFKPAAKRRWGYYALPVLHGDRLVGKVDATADHAKGVLRVNAIHEDVTFSKALGAAVRREIKDLAGCLGLEVSLPSSAARPTRPDRLIG
ncbi:DNA glycosylase AlkZ-like family protein [Luteipulveratus mongoliensis]|uniref:Winged helix-turn-helix domain-containing protein n=1 Tax=Luteipulveratus mongoliensis TaxID=571913 RepID=A0A0K1JMM4_9MICO|nr:crosslink repair DNA glycosylase YcaQ family protein [Luteipulveratus mongoliensis]AKU17966.1 hypothetical protein VV02_22375 [Luteipulveratus mongoliensis]